MKFLQSTSKGFGVKTLRAAGAEGVYSLWFGLLAVPAARADCDQWKFTEYLLGGDPRAQDGGGSLWNRS